MRFKHLLAGTLVAACISFTAPRAYAAFDAFLKIDGIEGESTSKDHKGEIEIESFSWGASQSGAAAGGGGGGAGKVVMKDFTFVHKVDGATPSLFLHCAQGKHIKEVKLTLRKAGGKGEVFLKVTLSDVLVSSVAPSGAAGQDRPTEEVKLKYAKINIEYLRLNAKGGVTPIQSGWDTKTNKGG
jgi:type VI secretion system secreted protein Hcp